jgi:hypothetical protein
MEEFDWAKSIEDPDPNNPADFNKEWESNVGMNFEFYQYQRLNIMVPRMAIFDPWVTLRVCEGYAAGSVSGSGTTRVPLGECRISLGPLLPWLKSMSEWHDTEPNEEFQVGF